MRLRGENVTVTFYTACDKSPLSSPIKPIPQRNGLLKTKNKTKTAAAEEAAAEEHRMTQKPSSWHQTYIMNTHKHMSTLRETHVNSSQTNMSGHQRGKSQLTLTAMEVNHVSFCMTQNRRDIFAPGNERHSDKSSQKQPRPPSDGGRCQRLRLSLTWLKRRATSGPNARRKHGHGDKTFKKKINKIK